MGTIGVADGRRKDPLIAPGELIENVNKRSEASNRKYRAFKNFLKQHSHSNNGSGGNAGGSQVTPSSTSG